MPVNPEPLTRIGAPPQPPNRRRRVNWVVWAPPIVIFIGLLALAGGAWWAGREPANADPDGPPQIETFTVSGYVTLKLGQFAWYSTDNICIGIRAFDDINLETQVVVSDASGKTLGAGNFGLPEVVKDPNDATRATNCRVPFAVNGVPMGHEFYGVQVGQRDKMSFNRFDIRQPLELKLD